MSNEQRDELFVRASFGKQVGEFWSSALGTYLRDRAVEEYTAAIRELKVCDPTDAPRISRLQGEVWRAESFETWMSEAILDGLKSLDLLESGEIDE
jgi:hypothetical protein